MAIVRRSVPGNLRRCVTDEVVEGAEVLGEHVLVGADADARSRARVDVALDLLGHGEVLGRDRRQETGPVAFPQLGLVRPVGGDEEGAATPRAGGIDSSHCSRLMLRI